MPNPNVTSPVFFTPPCMYVCICGSQITVWLLTKGQYMKTKTLKIYYQSK